MTDLVPAPGETHPAYAKQRHLIMEWLDNPHHQFGQSMRIPIPRTPLTWEAEPVVTADPCIVRTLTRRKAYGLAPYVGRPFVYQWYVGEDDLGRMVAGRWTWTRFTEGEIEYMIRTGDMDGPWARLSRPTDDGPAWPVQAVP